MKNGGNYVATFCESDFWDDDDEDEDDDDAADNPAIRVESVPICLIFAG